MLRITKQTDYGIMLLASMAALPMDHVVSAREVAEWSSLSVPMVSKVMKSLARAGVLESHRGSKGGFSLSRPPSDLSVADMIAALEGPVAMTECQAGTFLCQHEGTCGVQAPWNVINRSVQNTLSMITLSDLISPEFPLIQVTTTQ